jgi:CBS domain-containing protein
MAGTVSELMSTTPITISPDAPVSEAARMMLDAGVGAVVVVDGRGRVMGICTDRDITIRVTAAKRDPTTTVREACSDRDLVTVGSDTLIADALAIMKDADVRRLLVVDDDRLLGVVGVGDIAVAQDADSVLAHIRAAEPNR